VLPCNVRSWSTSGDFHDIFSPPRPVLNHAACLDRTTTAWCFLWLHHLIFGRHSLQLFHPLPSSPTFPSCSLSWRDRSRPTLSSALWSFLLAFTFPWSDFWSPHFLLLKFTVFSSFYDIMHTFQKLLFCLFRTFYLSRLRTGRFQWVHQTSIKRCFGTLVI